MARDGSLPWFDAHSCFGEVFAERGGFDLVVGNPPWVRAEEIPPRTREMLGERYRWWRGGSAVGFGHRPDLAVAFVERSLELAAPGGAVAMLLPAKLATAGYGTEMRAALAHGSTLDRVIDLGDSAAEAFAAVTYPLALVVRKRPPTAGHLIDLRADGSVVVPQAGWSGAPWILKDPDAGQLAEEMRTRHPALGSEIPIHLGVKCGRNAAYFDPPSTVEPELVRRAVRGRDLDPFEVTDSVRLLYPHDRSGRPLASLPPGALRHLGRFRRSLGARADVADGPWWALHRTAPASAPHRVAWPDLARRIEAVALPRDILPLNSCYLAVVRNATATHALASWLNSGWIRGFARLGADPARGGYSRFNARTVGALPLPSAAPTDHRLAELGAARAPTKERQDAIDRIVAELLGLDARDQRALRPMA